MIRTYLRPRHPLAVAGICVALAALTGCSSGDDLPTPVATGSNTVIQSDGHGSVDLGSFSAEGALSVSVVCSGKDTAQVSFPPSDYVATVTCLPRGSGTSQLATQTFRLDGRMRFHVKIAADHATHWALAGASR